MREPEDVFDPALYDDVRRPLGTATTLPFWCYTSPRWFEREMAEVFRPAWHFVGLASTLTRRGSYLTTSVLGEPVIIVRTDEGLRAYRNSCRHRGSILLEDRTGRCGGFRCRYHNWVYGLDGSLRRAPGTEEALRRAAAQAADAPVPATGCFSRRWRESSGSAPAVARAVPPPRIGRPS